MLLTFTYYDNYVDLIHLETSVITSMNSRETPCKFAILGSGPLPLTSLCILQALSNKGSRPITIQNIDRDARAISTSCQLCRKLGHSKTCMDFCCADVKSEGFDLYGFDVV